MTTLREELFEVMDAPSECNPPQFNNKYPFAKMKVNTYFFVEAISATNRPYIKKNVMSSAYRFGRHHRMIFTCKDVLNGFEVWRVK